MPGFANLDRNASNSVVSWRLLCSEFHKAPSNIVIGVRRWSTGDAKMSLEAQAAVAIMTDRNGGILMRVSSSQRYLEDAEDMRDPAVAVARRGKRPIPGKPEGRGKKHGRAARAAATTIPAHSAVSVDSPVITDDAEPNATAASNINVPESLLTTGGIEASPAPVESPLVTHTDAPASSHMSIPLDVNGNISAPSGSAFNPFITAESSALQSLAPMNNFPPTYQPQNPSSSRSVSAPQLRQLYGYGDLMSAYQGTLQPDSLGSSSFDAQRSYGPSQQSYGPSQQSYGPSQQSHGLLQQGYSPSQQNFNSQDFSAASHTGPDIWRVSTGSNFPP
ncbi:hypothetical protein BS47DRAFT_1336371 [Hydnum rufescens UP504]|uniref:Uncharacterized protein n=1 Tax=Hydnum rufescens UP504 TaxID=1448309 RepID=A0A9P6B969_9AGAM|nr:hypothetical protein BS47DRAFT_1336371 [Hydnum rufescens UP504]